MDNDYCLIQKLKDYEKTLGGSKKYRALHGGGLSFYEKWDQKLEVLFLDGIENPLDTKTFTAQLKVLLYKRKSDKEAYTYTLEDSIGEFEIKEDKLYYKRTNIKEKSESIKIPEISIFQIENQNLILLDNYLKDYEEKIILK